MSDGCDAWTRLDALVRARLRDMGLEALRSERREDDLLVALVGRDEHGHAKQTKLRTAGFSLETEASLAERADRMTRQQRGRFERANGAPPATVGPDMPMGHLEASAFLARRLIRDHGAGATDALRDLVLPRLAEGGIPAAKGRTPLLPSISGHRITHRETLAPGVHLRGDVLVLENLELPAAVTGELAGRAVRDVVEHPLIGRERILQACGVRGEAGRRTTTIRIAMEWRRGDALEKGEDS